MATNPNVNKVVLGGETLIDLTGDDVTPSDVLQGKSFHLGNGAEATGSLVPVLSVDNELPDADGNVSLGAYIKPNAGIPKTDLATGIKNSLDLADSSYQLRGAITATTDLTELSAGVYSINDIKHSDFPSSDLYYGCLFQGPGNYKPQFLIAGISGASNCYTRRWLTASAKFTDWISPYQKPADGIPESDLSSAVKVKLNEYSNRNLLDNAWFTVNQRGKTSYTGNGYGFDRWRTNFSGDTVSALTGGGVKNAITATTAGWHLHQIIDDCSLLIGKTLTVSCDVVAFTTNNVKLFVSFRNSSDSELSSKTVNLKTGIVTLSAVVPASTARIRVGFYASTNTTAGYISAKSLKLEQGSFSTLANDVYPNYSEELLKCQRYFLRVKPATACVYNGYITSSAKSYYFSLPISVPFRAVPTVTHDGVEMVIRTSTGYSKRTPSGSDHAIPGAFAVSYAVGSRVISIYDTVDTAVDTNNIVTSVSLITGTGNIDFSAEL